MLNIKTINSENNLPTGWCRKTLKQICSKIVGGGTPSTKNEKYWKGEIPWISSADIFDLKDIRPRRKITQEAIENSATNIVPQGTIIVVTRVGLGKVAVADRDLCFSQDNQGLIFFSKIIDTNYALYYLSTAVRILKISGRGTTINGVAKKQLEELEFKLPPLPEQHRIVAKIEELFSDLDNAVTNMRKVKAQLKTYRQAVLKYAFEGNLTADWRAAHSTESAQDLLVQIKTEREQRYRQQLVTWEEAVANWEVNSKEGKKPTNTKKPKELPPLTETEIAELPVLPSGWIYTYLSYVGDLARGKSKHRPRNDKKLFGGKYPFIQTGEVKAAVGLIKSYSQTYNDIGLSQSKLWPINTLCITIAANIAETAFLGIEACFPDSIVGFSGYDKTINSKFVDYFIQSTKQRIESFAPATAQKNINLNTLENLLIPYCSPDEQFLVVQEIESRFSVADKLEQTIDESLRKAEALRQSILKKAFEGELTSQWRKDHPELVSGENSAQALLKRIKLAKESQV